MNKKQIKDILSDMMHVRKKPYVLQMPITSRCNSRCKTCNVWKDKSNIDIDPIALKIALNDTFFSEVSVVGINGGEFTLVPTFLDIIKAVLSLPKLSDLYFISNGLFPQRLFEYMKDAKKICDERNVHIHLCISIDGIGRIHENVRGVPNCFQRTTTILDELYANKELYCHSFSVGCTLSKYNVAFLRETEAFFRNYHDLNVEYHLAVPNKRINTFSDYVDYTVLNDLSAKGLATEFFYEQFLNAKDESFKRQQFVNFYYLKNGGKRRLCKCDYLNRDITINENLNMFLCATASDVVGNLNEQNATDIVNGYSMRKECSKISKGCDTCIHYSYHPLTLRGRIEYINELWHSKFIYEYYAICVLKGKKNRFIKSISLGKRMLMDYLKLFYYYIWKLQ